MPDDAATPARGAATVLLSEFEEGSEQLRAAAAKRDRHFLWAGLGASPAVLPLLIGISGYGLYAVLGLSAVLSIVEARRGRKAMIRVRDLERLVAERRAEWTAALQSTPDASKSDTIRRADSPDLPRPRS